jgi:hypothetical protein
MNTPDDRIWDELGVTWRAAHIDTTALSRQLRRHLRRESWRRRLANAVGVIAATLVIIISVALIRMHHSAAQRVGVVGLAELVIVAAIGAWIYRSPTAGDTASLIGMLELAASHARRRRRDVGIFRCLSPVLWLILVPGILLAFRVPGPYWVIDVLILLAASIYGFFSAQRHYDMIRDREARFLHLRRELTAAEHDEQEGGP